MQDSKIIQFASDNYVGTHPEIIKKIVESMTSIELPYGQDSYSQQASKDLQKSFQTDCKSFFVGTGTAANVLALKTILKSHHAVVCTDIAHINGAECGALENMTGAKIFQAKHQQGKLTISAIENILNAKNDFHHNTPKAVSITQPTELGTVYTLQEIKEICDYAHSKNLFVHMDGARLANAAATLNVNLKEMVTDTGVDILSFGATKNGGSLAEAVVIFNKKLAEDFIHIQKQGMQLFSKSRIIPAQFIAYLKDHLWLNNAKHANRVAKEIAESLQNLKFIKTLMPVETNQIFIELPTSLKDQLLSKYYLYISSEDQVTQTTTFRIVTSYNTSPEDAQKLMSYLKSLDYDYGLILKI